METDPCSLFLLLDKKKKQYVYELFLKSIKMLLGEHFYVYELKWHLFIFYSLHWHLTLLSLMVLSICFWNSIVNKGKVKWNRKYNVIYRYYSIGSNLFIYLLWIRFLIGEQTSGYFKTSRGLGYSYGDNFGKIEDKN